MTETAMAKTKPPSTRVRGLVALSLVLAFGVAVGWISRMPDDRDLPLALALLAPILALAAAFAVLTWTLSYWRGMDEAAREAHKWAWYWGGSLGIVPGFLLALGEGGVALAGRFGFTEPAQLVEFGALSVLATMLVGYVLAWGFWWLRRR